MRKKYDKLRDQYPDYISLDQLRQICHIAKRSALYLINNGIIPAIDTGKKTWRYQISIDEVIRYLRRREQWGSMIPLGAVSSNSKKVKNHRVSLSHVIMLGDEKDVNNYFEQLYADADDILTAPQIIIMTGLSHKTVLSMLKDGDIKSLGSSPRYIVPKQFLLEFVSSRRFIDLKSNSEVFQKIIDGFDKWRNTGCIDYNPTKFLISK